jgi:aryl-phospho-beta-D-glucosidase BglC (GH1 family)
MNRCGNRTIALGCLLSALVCSTWATTPDPFLAANGTNIRNGHGTGDIVPLRGANLGAWLLMEGWMCPMDSSGLPDHYSVVQKLVNRFGVTTEESLIRTYQNTWITTNDLDNIRALGMNLVRVPIMWTDLQRLDGTWRTDAFDRLDWVVSNAWQRGIYTLLDLHGVPGGVSSSQSAGEANLNAYWTNAAYQAQTTLIWSNLAAHYVGNPAVAGYDLINEPYGAPTQNAIWVAYNSLYQTVRAVDPDHIIMMEGTWSGTGTNGQSLNWQWDVLPAPSVYNWSNVVYQMHAYAGSSSGVQGEVNKQTSDFLNHQSWNVPAYIGEFQGYGTGSAWQYAVTQFNTNGMSWSTWAYKASNGTVASSNSWGIYDPTNSSSPPTPNIQTDSSGTISNDWSQWTTGAAFGITPFLKQFLGEPLGVADSYSVNAGSTLVVNSGSGLLANDIDINKGQPGIQLTARLVNGPTNGQLGLSLNGAFSYTPTNGFSGTDTFRYLVNDGYANSVNITTVSIQVLPQSVPAAPTGLTATGGDAQVSLSWNSSVGATSYNVKRALTSGGPSYATVLAGLTSTVATDSSVSNGTPYYYVVSAVNGIGEGSNSTEATATPLSAYQQWQILYFGSIDNPAGAPDADADGDGQSNLQEFLAGTDPTNATSCFQITSIIVQSNGVGIAWVCSGGTTNVLQVASAVGGTYSNVSPNLVIAGSGVTTTNYLDPASQTVVSGTASDTASDSVYTGGNFNGANGGSGFGPWMVNPANNTGNILWFITTSTTNGSNPSGGIDSAGNASWGSFANNGGTGTAVRAFSAGALAPGQVLTLDMDNGYVEANGSVGFNLQNASGLTLMQINYIGMNPGGSYGLVDSSGAHSLGVPYTDRGVHAQITLISSTAYSLSLTPLGASTVNFNGTLINPSGGQGIAQVQLFDNNAAAANTGSHWDVFWNNFNISGVTNNESTGLLSAPSRFYRVLLVP